MLKIDFDKLFRYGRYNALTDTKIINVQFSQLLSGADNHELCVIIIQV